MMQPNISYLDAVALASNERFMRDMLTGSASELLTAYRFLLAIQVYIPAYWLDDYYRALDGAAAALAALVDAAA